MSATVPTASRRPSWLAVVEVSVVIAILAAGYWWVYQSQRALFTAGLPTEDPYAFPRPGADLNAVEQAVDHYRLAIAVVLCGYGWLLFRSRSSAWRRVAWLPLGLTAAVHLAWIAAKPSLSIDVLSYLSHGYLAATGQNPYFTASADVADLPYGPRLIEQGWYPVHPQTPYGPLWTEIERLVYLASGDRVSLGIMLFKIIAVGATLGSAVFVWLIVRRVSPGHELVGALGLLANPVIVVEFAGDGHNDALAILALLAATWAALRSRPALTVIMLSLGVLIKFSPAIFALPLLVLLIRHRRSRRRLLIGLGIGAAAAVALTWLLYRRWWIGIATFDGLRSTGTPSPSWSPSGLLATWFSDPDAYEIDQRPTLILAGLLIIGIMIFGIRRHDRPAIAGISAIALVALAVLPSYWPWYAALPIALLCLRPNLIGGLQLLVVTIGSRVVAPYGDLFAIGALPWERSAERTTLLGIDIPIACCLLIAAIAGFIGLGQRTSVTRRPYRRSS